jgi:hypothetical protein
MIDIVTVAFEDESEVLRLQARSLELFVKDVDSVVVVVNQDTACHIDTRWWGIHQPKVTVMHRKIFGNSWSPNGWVSQQALKLLATGQCASEWAVILDAKTIFVKNFELDEIRPAVGVLDIYPVFEPSRDIANSLFGVDLQQQLGPGGVPFVMNTQQARDMIAWIERHIGQSFANWFQQQGRLTEFILYSAWIQYRTGSLNSIYNTETTNTIPVNICHSEVARFEQKLAQMPSAATVSIHRNAWAQLNDSQRKSYMDFLHSRGIQ